jgi:hypothetical protein
MRSGIWSVRWGLVALLILDLSLLWLCPDSNSGGYDHREVWDPVLRALDWMANKKWCESGGSVSSGSGALALFCRAGSSWSHGVFLPRIKSVMVVMV